jgi:hypothetical protein
MLVRIKMSDRTCLPDRQACRSRFDNLCQPELDEGGFDRLNLTLAMHTNFIGSRINIKLHDLLPSPVEKGWG